MPAAVDPAAAAAWLCLLQSLCRCRRFPKTLHPEHKTPAGHCVVNVYINYEKKFAFVEFRTVEETSNAMALDGIMFEV